MAGAGDRVTANLPAKDFDATVDFYGRMGFDVDYRDDHWLILRRDALEIEFFPHPEVDPKSSWFSACIRVDDLEAFHAEWRALDLPRDHTSIPRITGIMDRPPVPRMFALIDADGSLLRVLENDKTSATA
ncbi:bleomycin resistance protein [Pseudooceanicola onchidii]|uniref:bleomycin resistance protein n=1 Tax=Pseudooceanicola onchidii TaxID=2562279 RepID=UPI0010A9BCDF|nr:bleomycin resistance protein [Pseudooceanicola onchidii]